ncbi:sigma-70 family RNA polymerase sigma factor [Candidatus Gracilibacteria bacterium]|nr:sigma-70 family RNA polymerase sigma factor [Candidatus Gracilibacteria bacterium]
MSDYNKFQEYYEEYMPRIFGYVYNRVGFNRALAEDIVSEVFLKALEKFDLYSEEKGTFKSWIFRVTKNHMIDHFKAKKNKPKADLDKLSNILPDKSNVEKDTGREMEKEKLLEAMSNLSEQKKELISLRYFSGYSYKEMAEILNSDEAKMRVQVFRTLKSLKGTLFELNYSNEDGKTGQKNRSTTQRPR